jgi:hypothetical protein
MTIHHKNHTGLAALATFASLFLTTWVQADGAWNPARDQERIGRIYYYERSNIDGSMDERVTVFRKEVGQIEVYKENGLCGNAALVTADFDPDSLSAPRITGGALKPDARHVEFAFLEFDAESRQLDMMVHLPDQEIRNQAEVRTMPWVLFDFDLASLTIATPYIDNRKDGFAFGMALVWADLSVADPLIWMGDVQANYQGEETHLGVASEYYELTGSAFEGERSVGSTGALWLDAREGHVVDAVMPVPNHPGYTDFRLRLIKVSDGGEAEWNQLLTAHFEGCD